MRAWLVLLGLLALAATPAQPSRAAGAPAQAQTPAAGQTLGLRGSIPAPGASDANTDAAATPAAPATTSSASPIGAPPPSDQAPSALAPSAPALSPLDADAALDDCRLSCAHSYYFCLASPDSGDCAGTWRGCLNACEQPPNGA